MRVRKRWLFFGLAFGATMWWLVKKKQELEEEESADDLTKKVAQQLNDLEDRLQRELESI